MHEKNILYITYDGLTDPLGQSQVLPYLEGLADLGYGITIVSFEKRKFQKTTGAIEARLRTKPTIHWRPLTYTKSPPVLSTVYDLIKLRLIIRNLRKKVDYALIHCRSYIPALVALPIKRRSRIPFIFDMRGFWADERVDGGLWNLKNPIYKWVYNFFKRKEIDFLDNADKIVSLTHRALDTMCTWPTSSDLLSKTTVIPCCVDVELFSNQSAQGTTRRDLNLKESDIIFTYLGSIGTWYMLPEMLRDFKRIQTNVPHAKFLFVTRDEPSHILTAAKEENVETESLRFFSADRNQVPSLIALSDFGLFYIKPSFSKYASSPTKMAEFLSMGTPIISNAGVGDSDKFFEMANIGVLVKKAGEMSDPELRMVTSTNWGDMRGLAVENFSLKSGIAKYNRIYRGMLNGAN